MVDGQEGPEYEGICQVGIGFSPDGKHVAYIANRGDRQFVVLDGQENGAYEGIGVGPLFGGDSGRVAYSAQKGRKQVVVVNGEEGPEYTSILSGPVFRRDGALEYIAADKNRVLYRVTVPARN